MWIADMDYEIAQPIQDALIQRITNSGFGYEYKPDSFLKAQKTWYKTEYGINLNTEHVVCSTSITNHLIKRIKTAVKYS